MNRWLIALIIAGLSALFIFNKRGEMLENNFNQQTFKGRNYQFCSPLFDPADLTKTGAPLLKGLGNLHYPVTTTSSLAQKYFNQGLTLMYAFNHGESARSFKEAIKLDSTCAMAYWGVAMVLGPNYNAALNPSSLGDINGALNKAVLHSATATPKEKDLITALTKRFPKAEVTDMTPFNAAYAAAIKALYEKYPQDLEMATLYIDALMNEHPWNLWLKDGQPQPWTPAIIELIEKVMAKSPNNFGAIHYYIHATEASKQPQKALPGADKLRNLLPGAGHLVHMPSHTYIRTGHYHKGVVANEKASLVDSTYIAQCKAEGFYPMLLYPHNVHFLAACAFLEGNSKKALQAAWRVSAIADKRYITEVAAIQHYYIIPFYVMVQLGEWNKILELPMPGESLLYPRAIWHYARGMAYAAKGDRTNAEKELKTLENLRQTNEEQLKKFMIWDTNSANDLITIAKHVLTGEIAGTNKQYEVAVAELVKAIAIEDALNYQEPPDWFFSVRHTLGHVLLQAKRFTEAEKVYNEDLSTFPENGWALMGLYKSLLGQGKTTEAKAVKKRFDKAWQWADIAINSSRKY